MKGFIQIIAGLILLVAVLFTLTYSSWFWATIRLIQGSLILLVFFIALGLILLGASDIKG